MRIISVQFLSMKRVTRDPELETLLVDFRQAYEHLSYEKLAEVLGTSKDTISSWYAKRRNPNRWVQKEIRKLTYGA